MPVLTFTPPLRNEGLDAIWQCYQQFDGSSLSFNDHAFDVVIFSDVLQHVPAGLVSPLLKSAARVGRFVLIRDHFEYGWFSSIILRAMDFVGNLSSKWQFVATYSLACRPSMESGG